MADIIRHRGHIHNTGTRCAVVFRELPNDQDHCLIIESDSLPEVYRDEVAAVINKEGQRTKDLYEALNSAYMPTGEHMLTALHTHKLLKRKETKEIVMQVTSSDTIRLDKLNEQLRALTDSASTVAQPKDIQAKLNPYEEINDIETSEDAMNVAKNLLIQANDLEQEVQKKRDRAYALRPELKPQESTTDTNIFTIDLNEVQEKDAIANLKRIFREKRLSEKN